jgi:hypothetical protein
MVIPMPEIEGEIEEMVREAESADIFLIRGKR